MIYGYLKARSLKEVEDFKRAIGTENVFADAVGSYEEAVNAELSFCIDQMVADDILIVPSLEEAFADFSELNQAITAVFTKDIEFKTLEELPMNVNNQEAESMKSIMKFGLSRYRDSQVRHSFPDRFYPVYSAYKAGEIHWKDAIKELKISQGTFYSMVKLFERD